MGYRTYALVYRDGDKTYRLMFTDVNDSGIWYVEQGVPPIKSEGMAKALLRGLQN